MSKQKILRDYYSSITYSENDWSLLNRKRKRAIELLEIFTKEGLKPFVYGSVARGNVHEASDIDIIFFQQIPSFLIENILNKNGFEQYFREIIMATPRDSIKLYIYLNEIECITLPLTKLEKTTMEFYSFGGKIDLKKLNGNIRVPGIDKRLILINPTSLGHEESSIINNEHIAAKEVGVSLDTIIERKKVLLRREKHGKTGVFLKKEININESVEEVLKNLANKKRMVRNKLFKI